jgi:hypothetical protein
MRSTNRWWSYLVLVGMLVIAGCASGSIDDPDSAPVYLRLDALDSPAVTGSIQGSGTCSGDPTIPCTSDFVCSSAQPAAGFCQNIPCVRTINEWTANLSNVPKNSSAVTSPFNDIILDRLLISYNPALSGVASQVVGLGGVHVPAASAGVVTFAPIIFQALAAIPINASTTTNLTISFEGHTPVNDQIVSGPSSTQLFIEECFGGN